MVYNNNVPLGNQTIASTTDPIRNNFAFLQDAIGQEHNFDPTDPANTYHLQAAMPNQGSASLPAGTNGMYYVNNGQARFLTGSGNTCRITDASQSSNGYQWIGRVVIQWGNVAVSSGATGTINFPIAFNTLYSLQLTVDRTPTSSVVANFTAASATNFTYRISADPCSLMYWMAIGTSSLP